MTDTLTDNELRFERSLAALPETVWRWLTEPQLRARWFMGGPIDGRAGGSIGFVFDHDALSDDDVPMPARFAGNRGAQWSETITRWDPPHVLAYTFGEGSSSTATFTLEPEGDGRTRLTLVHSNIPGRAEAINFGGGWTAHLAALQARLAGDGVPNFWSLHAAAEAKITTELG